MKDGVAVLGWGGRGVSQGGDEGAHELGIGAEAGGDEASMGLLGLAERKASWEGRQW